MSPIRSFCARPLQLWAAIALLVVAAVPVGASLPAGKAPVPQLLAPVAGTSEHESGLRLAWRPASPSSKHIVVVARAPFTTDGWTRLPQDPALQVHRVATPVVSLADLGLTLDADTRLWWAAGSEDAGSGYVSFSEVRSFFAIRKFTSHIEPSPFLRRLPRGTVVPETRREPDLIRLGAGYTIDPRRGEPALPEHLTLSGLDAAAARTFLVYYGDMDPEQARQRVLESGGAVVANIPDRSFVVRAAAPPDLSGVAWIGPFQPAYKLSPRIGSGEDAQTLDVLVFDDGALDAVAALVQSSGGQVLATSDNGINKLLRVSLAGALIGELARHPDVAWIEPFVIPELNNLNVQWVVQTGTSGNRRVWDLGIRGEGQIIMTSDSGVNVTHNMFRDVAVAIPDFGDYETHRKIIAYKMGSPDPRVAFGDHSGASWHGSHTAGTALGDDGTGINGYDGVAKSAKLYFMDISGPDLANTVSTPLDLNDLFLPPYIGNGAGAARVSSNSWGASVGGAYDLNCVEVDQFVWNHPDMLICFSNGNSGPGINTVGSPAGGKNVVGVGGTGNSSQMNTIYASTSRGPTDDGRRKPTICSPGANVLSSTTPPSTTGNYSGTSMASPGTAAAITLMRQYLTEGWYPTGTKIPANAFTPTAALLRAMAVNSGANTITGQTTTFPNDNIGWGRINCDSVLYFAGDVRRLLLVDDTDGLGNLQSIEFQVNVTDPSIPMEVALAWSDYPGTPLASIALVNDLDLTVTNGVVTYRGNSYTGGVSNTLNVQDRRNVEETVLISAPAAGLWTIRIDGYFVPSGPQPFGLCITGGIGTSAGTVALDRTVYGSASTVEVRVTDTNAAGTVTVTMTSSTEPAGETMIIAGGDGLYDGTIPLSPFVGSSGDGILQVSNGDVISATYQDASPSATLLAEATVSLEPPIITDVAAALQVNGAALISWKTNENATSRVYYGTTPALENSTTLDPHSPLDHLVALSGLTVGQTYYYDVESQDLEGNVTRADNGGAHYQFTLNPPGDILLVYGGDDFERPGRYTDAMNRHDWLYDVWKGPLSETPLLGDLSSGLRSYRAVWWQVGLEYYPPFSDDARTAITDYLDGGGRLAVVGNDIAWAFGDTTTTGGVPNNPYYTLDRENWMKNTLHTVYVTDPAGWSSVSGVVSDPISGAYTGGLSYQEHRSGASGDEIDFFPGAGSSAGSWRSGDGTPDDAGFRWESSSPQGTAGTAVWGGQTSRLASMNFEWSGINPAVESDATRAAVLDKTLTWLLGRARPVVMVVSPNGGSPITTDTFDITWNETLDGTSAANRRIEYSLDGGQSWIEIASGVGPSPYNWDLTSVPNDAQAMVRVYVTDDGDPSLTGRDQSNATFAIQRASGDVVGPAVVAGTIRVNPNPIDAGTPSTLTATLSDSLYGGSNVAAAEFSYGDAPAPAGSGTAMTGSFSSQTVVVSVVMNTSGFAAGPHHLYVRGQDAAGNWGNAAALPVVVNNPALLSVGDVPRAFELRQNAPNPVVHNTVISFAVPVESPVELQVFDVQGRQVRHLVQETLRPGVYHVPWNGTDESGRRVEPGLYYYRLLAGNRSFERRLVTLQ